MNSQRIAVVTGAAQGIGSAVSRRLALSGHVVIGIDVNEVGLQELSEEIGSGSFKAVSADVAESSTWQTAQELGRELGEPLSILVNNAAISPKHDGRRLPSNEVGIEEWERVLRVNVTASFMGFQAVIDDMVQAGWGRIIMVSSGAAKMGARVAGVHYGTSKAAQLGLMRTLAWEFGPSGVTVNAVTPGRIATPMAEVVSQDINAEFLAQIPVGRLGTGDDIAATVNFLASDDAGFINGATIDVNGGGYIG